MFFYHPCSNLVRGMFGVELNNSLSVFSPIQRIFRIVVCGFCIHHPHHVTIHFRYLRFRAELGNFAMIDGQHLVSAVTNMSVIWDRSFMYLWLHIREASIRLAMSIHWHRVDFGAQRRRYRCLGMRFFCMVVWQSEVKCCPTMQGKFLLGYPSVSRFCNGFPTRLIASL